MNEAIITNAEFNEYQKLKKLYKMMETIAFRNLGCDTRAEYIQSILLGCINQLGLHHDKVD